MSATTVRAAIATALQTIPGLHASQYLTDKINPPQAFIDYDVDYSTDMAGGATYLFVVEVYVNRSSERGGQRLLDLYRDPDNDTYGIAATLETDAGIAAVVDSIDVRRGSRLQAIETDGAKYLVVEFEVEVLV